MPTGPQACALDQNGHFTCLLMYEVSLIEDTATPFSVKNKGQTANVLESGEN